MQENEAFYPEITEDQLWPFLIVKRLLQENPDLFDDPKCPYNEGIRGFFASIPLGDDTSVEGEISEVLVEDLEEEASRLYQELKKFGQSLEAGDTSERNTYFRLSVSLLEKILELKERAVGLKNVKHFTDTVLQIMEDILTPDQRTKIMDRLQESIDNG